MKKKLHVEEAKQEIQKKFKAMGPIKLTVLALMIIATVCSYVFHDYIFGEGSYFLREAPTQYGAVNTLIHSVPNIVKGVRIITIGLVIITVLTFLLGKIFKRNQREITVVRLTNSIIRVAGWAAMAIAVLAVWGVNTAALITGAGVITLVVGLGMQSLISDVVAGLFIVFENEFNVGDIITIDDFRGTVLDIGIRTTKLEAVGNIKIINNSDIRGVLNQSVKLSTAKTLISIEYGESLSRVEGIIKEKLPLVQVEGAKSEVTYNGVSELGDSGVTLLFTVSCAEGDIFSVTRDMNGKIKNMFDENGISIPFPQIVVHTEK